MVLNNSRGVNPENYELKGCGKVSAGDEVCGEDYTCHECNNHLTNEMGAEK